MASNSYSTSTNFSVAENPISESGQFVTSTSLGVDWSGLKLGGSGSLPVAPVDIAAPGMAESADYANPNYGDALAVVIGDWGPDQSVSITVGDIAPTIAGYEEFEIHLRTDPTTGTGYEVAWAYNHDYILIATWNGGGVVGAGAYTTLFEDHGPQYAIAPGDTLTASIQGDVITVSTNGVQVAQIADNTFSSGNPGFGFNEGGTDQYGISSFSASSSESNPTDGSSAGTSAVGVGDVNGDGHSEVVTQSQSGQIDILSFDDQFHFVESNPLRPGTYDPIHDVVSPSNGTALLLTQSTSGTTTEQTFDGNQVTGSHSLDAVGLALVPPSAIADHFLV